MKIPYETRQRIKDQAMQEISWNRTYKQGKVTNWRLNEDLYYGRKLSNDTSRANVDLGRMQEFVHTLLSKVDNALVFNFIKRKNAEMKRVERLNALRLIDQQEGDWDMKDIAGKKQAIIYGRAIYSYHADSSNGYKSHLENVDVYDFLIDPSGGGLDIERAMNMGRYGVIKSRSELKEGVKNKMYLRTETEELLAGAGNSTEQTQETVNQMNRTKDTNVWTTQKNIGNPDKFVFWEWYTTYDGERYYLLLTENGNTAVRVEKLTDIFATGMWPFWTWAAFIDLTEFWTPSFADYVREVFMAQSVSINQMLDNAEQRNKPQRAVDVIAIKDLSQLKYQRGGNFIEVTGGMNVNNAIVSLEVPGISTPLDVYDKLESIVSKASGVTEGAAGSADPSGKATIYEGNQANAADRFGLLNKSYSFGYKRFADLWQCGVDEHLTTPMAIEILGPDGVEMQKISRKDIFRKGEKFKALIESSDAETAQSELEKRTKIQFLAANAANPIQNPKKAYEQGASISGFDQDTILQLLDTSDFGDASIMSEADRDIEDLLDGKKIRPNEAATAAYKQRFVNYIRDNQEQLKEEQINMFFDYIDQLDPIIMRNMATALSQSAIDQQLAVPEPPMGVPGLAEDPMANINQLAPSGI